MPYADIELKACTLNPYNKETTMRLFALAALAITAFVTTMIIDRTDANAVVYCAAGVYRAGCVVRPRGVHPYAHPYVRPYRRVY